MCKRGHAFKGKPKYLPSVCILKQDQTIREFFKATFKTQNLEERDKCKHDKCNKKVQTEKKKIMTLPQVLVFMVPHGRVIPGKKIMFHIDVQKFLTNESKVKMIYSKYHLGAIAQTSKGPIDDSMYTIFVRREPKEKKQKVDQVWLEFSKDFRDVPEWNSVFKKLRPQILVYHLVKKEKQSEVVQIEEAK